MKRIAKELVLLLTFLLVCAIYVAPMAIAADSDDRLASPDPLNVCWLVTDPMLTPVDGAELTIFWATDALGPFTKMDASIVYDRVNGAYQNPIVSGYWNPSYPHGMANADLEITSVSSYFFFVNIEYDSVEVTWPMMGSTKPGDMEWGYPEEVVDAATPSGYAATGNGLGNGPTTAYPTYPPPDGVIPEVPFGTIAGFLSMIAVLVGFVGVRRFRPRSQ